MVCALCINYWPSLAEGFLGNCMGCDGGPLMELSLVVTITPEFESEAMVLLQGGIALSWNPFGKN